MPADASSAGDRQISALARNGAAVGRTTLNCTLELGQEGGIESIASFGEPRAEMENAPISDESPIRQQSADVVKDSFAGRDDWALSLTTQDLEFALDRTDEKPPPPFETLPEVADGAKNDCACLGNSGADADLLPHQNLSCSDTGTILHTRPRPEAIARQSVSMSSARSSWNVDVRAFAIARGSIAASHPNLVDQLKDLPELEMQRSMRQPQFGSKFEEVPNNDCQSVIVKRPELAAIPNARIAAMLRSLQEGIAAAGLSPRSFIRQAAARSNPGRDKDDSTPPRYARADAAEICEFAGSPQLCRA